MKTLNEIKQTMKMNESSMSSLSKIEQKNIIAGASGNRINTVSAECTPDTQAGRANCTTIGGYLKWAFCMGLAR